MNQSKPFVLFVLGGPGAGKGTQCVNLVRDYNFVHLSAGDLLRAERKKDTENARIIQDNIANGKIVPVEITVALIKAAMRENGWERSRFLIDGFPRNQENFEGWQAVVGNEADVKGILYFNCSEEVMKQRILKRGETSGRVDDNVDVIVKRFNTYKNETYPVIMGYAQNGGNVYAVNAEGTPEQVYGTVREIMDSII